MSSDSQPSLRAHWKAKIKNIVKPNITSSIRERLIPNDTYHDLREKYQNFTDIAKDRTGIGMIINKTKTLIPGVISSNNNQTFSKGFYDSLFNPQTTEDVYFKVAIVCLWVIAILCIIPTIITICILFKRYGLRKNSVKMIFFHIFLCELFYLIYILLSMINVARNFQLGNLFCSFANYAMYITIPVMHCALFFLSLERLSQQLESKLPWTRIFTKSYVIPVILFTIWIIFIAIMATIMLIKGVIFKTIKNNVNDMAPEIAREFFSKLSSSSYQCSIDGRLSSVFKILLIIIFIILIVLIIKSAAISIFYNIFTSMFFKLKIKIKKPDDRYMTLLCLIFLLLNVCFSFPFYFASMATTITQLITRQDTYSTYLKICFLLRISSIILQCLTFITFEKNSWDMLSRLLYRVTCKKFPILISDIPIRKPTKTNKSRHVGHSDDNIDSHDSDDSISTDSDDNNSENEDDDDVFLPERKTEPLRTKKSGTTTTTTTVDVFKTQVDTDDETQSTQKSKLSTRKSNEKRNKIEQEKMASKKLPSEYNKTNGISQKTSNDKLISQGISSTMTKPKTLKLNTNHNMTKHQPIETSSSSSSSSSDDDHENLSVIQCSDDENRPSKDISKTKPTTYTSTNEQKRTVDILPHKNHWKPQQHRVRNHLQSSSSTNYSHVKTKRRRKRSSTNKTNHTGKPKQDRLNKMLANSDYV
ncbi:unnamed protein product [Rotaria sp. Silwood1]|nr:unnamed protein product [Rotaria sp. Silwood1]CAF1070188.1 unnamed protein product [Rotaria sp. Silwood1]CAF3421006.1 unnamed protein product [Rotaria sp. Silwood1]CAF4547902.1 unnamed protein product [Rotaria sp. Silwood1]